MNENTMALIQAAQEGDKEALNTLIVENEMLIWSIVKRFYNRGAETEDLFQIGSIGFIKAVQRFDFGQNVMFSTYAVPMILGEIRRFLRDDGMIKVSRSLKEKAIKARQSSERIMKEQGREATLSEISEATGMDQSEIAMALSATTRPESIHQPVGGDTDLTLLDVVENEQRFDEEVISNLVLKEAAERLEIRDRQILVLRYFKNKTQTQVADMLGISQVQVSRLEKKMLGKLKEYIS